MYNHSINKNDGVISVAAIFVLDVNECIASSPVCDVNAICNNTLGSYLCTCKLGFSGDGKTCQGKDSVLGNMKYENGFAGRRK